MKKLLILSIAVLCVGCSDVCDPAYDYDPTDISGNLECSQPEGESCGFLQEWDACFCECDWVF